MKLRPLNLRIRAAWNALRGRPTIAFNRLLPAGASGIRIHPDDAHHCVIVGNRIIRP